MSGLRVLTPREASIFACFADAVVAPEPPLPPVAQTDAAFAFDAVLAASPPVNRRALRAALLALELAPLATPARARLRRLDAGARRALLARLERNGLAAGPLTALRGLAHMSYYGDDGVMRLLGYAPDAVVARAAAARAANAAAEAAA